MLTKIKKKIRVKNKDNKELLMELNKYEEQMYLKKDVKKELAIKNIEKILKEIRKRKKVKDEEKRKNIEESTKE